MPYALKLTFRGVCRKFVFADRTALNWDNLDRNVRSLFNIDFPFFLQYEDEEGEVITCSSTFELREILPFLDDTGARAFRLSIMPLDVPAQAVYSRIHHYANDYSDGPSSFSSFDSSIDRLQRQQNLEAGVGVEGGAPGLPRDDGAPIVTQPHLGGHKRRYRHASTAPPPPVDMATTGTDPRSFAELNNQPPPLPSPPPVEVRAQIASGEFPSRWPRVGARVLPSGVDPQRLPTVPISSVSVPTLPTYWNRPPSLPASFFDPSIQLEGQAAPSSHSRKPSFMEGASSVENLVSGPSVASKFRTSSLALGSVLADVPEHHEMEMSRAELATQRSSVMSQKHSRMSSRPPSGASVQHSQFKPHSSKNSRPASLHDAPGEPDLVASNSPPAATSRESVQRSKHTLGASVQQASLHTLRPTPAVPSHHGSANTSKLHHSDAKASQNAPPEVSGSQRQPSKAATPAAVSVTSAAVESKQGSGAALQEPQTSKSSSKIASQPGSIAPGPEAAPETAKSIHGSAAPSVLRASRHSVVASPPRASVHASRVSLSKAGGQDERVSRVSGGSRVQQASRVSRNPEGQDEASPTSPLPDLLPPSAVTSPRPLPQASLDHQSGMADAEQPDTKISSKAQSLHASKVSVHASVNASPAPGPASAHPSMVKSASASRHSASKQKSSVHASRQEPAANTSTVPPSADAVEPEQVGDEAVEEPQTSKAGSVAAEPEPEAVPKADKSVHGSAAPSVLRASRHSVAASPPRASVHQSMVKSANASRHSVSKQQSSIHASRQEPAANTSALPPPADAVEPEQAGDEAVEEPQASKAGSVAAEPEPEVVPEDNKSVHGSAAQSIQRASRHSVATSVHQSMVKSQNASRHSVSKQKSSAHASRQEPAASTSAVPPSAAEAEPEQTDDGVAEEPQASKASSKKASRQASMAAGPEAVQEADKSVHGSAAQSIQRASRHSVAASVHQSMVKSANASRHSVSKQQSSIHASRHEPAANTPAVSPSADVAEAKQEGDAAIEEPQASKASSKKSSKPGSVAPEPATETVKSIHGSAAPSVLRASRHSVVASPPRASVHASRVSLSKVGGQDEASPTSPLPDLLPPSAVTSPRPLPQASLDHQSGMADAEQPDTKISSKAQSLHASKVSVHASVNASPAPGPASAHPSMVKSPSASRHSVSKQQSSVHTSRQEPEANTSAVPPSAAEAEPEQAVDDAAEEPQASKPGSVAAEHEPEAVPKDNKSVHGSTAPSVLRASRHSVAASVHQSMVKSQNASCHSVSKQQSSVHASRQEPATNTSAVPQSADAVEPEQVGDEVVEEPQASKPGSVAAEPEPEVVPEAGKSVHGSAAPSVLRASRHSVAASVHQSMVKSVNASRHSVSKQQSSIHASRQEPATNTSAVPPSADIAEPDEAGDETVEDPQASEASSKKPSKPGSVAPELEASPEADKSVHGSAAQSVLRASKHSIAASPPRSSVHQPMVKSQSASHHSVSQQKSSVHVSRQEPVANTSAVPPSADAAEPELADDAAPEEPQASKPGSVAPEPEASLVADKSVQGSAAQSIQRASRHSVAASVHQSMVKSANASRHSVSKQQSSVPASRQEPAASTSAVPSSVDAAVPEQADDAIPEEPPASKAGSVVLEPEASPEAAKSVRGSAAQSVLRASRHSVAASPPRASVHQSMVKSANASRHSVSKQQSSAHVSRQEPAANTSAVPPSTDVAEPEQAGDGVAEEPQASKPGSVVLEPEVVPEDNKSIHASAAQSIQRASRHSVAASVHQSMVKSQSASRHSASKQKSSIHASRQEPVANTSAVPPSAAEAEPEQADDGVAEEPQASKASSKKASKQASMAAGPEAVQEADKSVHGSAAPSVLRASRHSVAASAHQSMVKSANASRHSVSKQQSSVHASRQEPAANTSAVPPSADVAEAKQEGDAAIEEPQASKASSEKSSKPGSVAPEPATETAKSIHGSAAPSVLRASRHSVVASPPRASVHASRVSLSKVGGQDEASPTSPLPDLLPPSAVTSPRPLPQASLDHQSGMADAEQPDTKISSKVQSLHASKVSVHASVNASPAPGPASAHPSMVKSPSAHASDKSEAKVSMKLSRQSISKGSAGNQPGADSQPLSAKRSNTPSRQPSVPPSPGVANRESQGSLRKSRVSSRSISSSSSGSISVSSGASSRLMASLLNIDEPAGPIIEGDNKSLSGKSGRSSRHASPAGGSPGEISNVHASPLVRPSVGSKVASKSPSRVSVVPPVESSQLEKSHISKKSKVSVAATPAEPSQAVSVHSPTQSSKKASKSVSKYASPQLRQSHQSLVAKEQTSTVAVPADPEPESTAHGPEQAPSSSGPASEHKASHISPMAKSGIAAPATLGAAQVGEDASRTSLRASHVSVAQEREPSAVSSRRSKVGSPGASASHTAGTGASRTDLPGATSQKSSGSVVASSPPAETGHPMVLTPPGVYPTTSMAKASTSGTSSRKGSKVASPATAATQPASVAVAEKTSSGGAPTRSNQSISALDLTQNMVEESASAAQPSSPTSKASKPTSPVGKPNRSRESLTKTSYSSSKKSSKHPTPAVQTGAAVPTPLDVSVHKSVDKTASEHHSPSRKSHEKSVTSIHAVPSKSASKASSAVASPQPNSPLVQGSTKHSVAAIHNSAQSAQVPEQPQETTASAKSATPPAAVSLGQASPAKATPDRTPPGEPAVIAQPEKIVTSSSSSSSVQSRNSSSSPETRMKASPLPVVTPGGKSPPSKAQSNAEGQTSQVRPQVSIDRLVSPVSSAIEKIRSIANSSTTSISRAKLAEKKSTTSHATNPTSSHSSVPIPQDLSKTSTPHTQGTPHRASAEHSSRVSPANQGSPVASPTQSSMLSHQAASRPSSSRITSSRVQRTSKTSHSSVAELVEHFSRKSSHGSVKATSRPTSERGSPKSSKPVTPPTGSHSKANSEIVDPPKSKQSPSKGSGSTGGKAASQKSVKPSAAPSKVPSPELHPSQEKVKISASASQRMSKAPSEVADEPAKEDTVSFLDATFTTSVVEERNERIGDLRDMLVTLAESLSNLYPDYGPPASNILPRIPKHPADSPQQGDQIDGNTASKKNLEKSALPSVGGSPVLKTQPPTTHHSSPPSRTSQLETQKGTISKSKAGSKHTDTPAAPPAQHIPELAKSQSLRQSPQAERTPAAVIEAQAASKSGSVAASATTPAPVANKSGRGSARASLAGSTSALLDDSKVLPARSRISTRRPSPPRTGHQSPAQVDPASNKDGSAASIPEASTSPQPAGDIPQITVEGGTAVIEPVTNASDPTAESATGKVSFIGVPSLKVVTPGGSVHESKIDSPHSLAVSSQTSQGSPSSPKQDPGVIPQGDEHQSVAHGEESVLSQAVAKAEAALASVEALNSAIRQTHPVVGSGGKELDASLLAAAQIPLPLSQATSHHTSACTSPLAKSYDSLSHNQEALPAQVEPTGDPKSPFLTASFAAGFPLPPSGAGSFFSVEGTYTTSRTPGGSPVLSSFKHHSQVSGQPDTEVVTAPDDAADQAPPHLPLPSITASQAAQYRLPSSVSGSTSRHGMSRVEPQPEAVEPTAISPTPEHKSGTRSPHVAAKPPSASGQGPSPEVVASQHSVKAGSTSAGLSKAASIRTRVSNSLASLMRVATNLPLPSSVSGSDVGSSTSPHSPGKSSLKRSSSKAPGVSVPPGNTSPLPGAQPAEAPVDKHSSHNGKSSSVASGVSLPGSPPAVTIEGYGEGGFPLNGPPWVPIDDPLAIPLAIDEMLDQLHEVTDMLKNLVDEHPNLVEPITDVIRKVQNTVLNSIDHVTRSSVASMSRSPSYFVGSSRMPTVPASKVPSALGRPPVMGTPKRRVSAVASPLAANHPVKEPSVSEASDRKSKVTAVPVTAASKTTSSRSGSGTSASHSACKPTVVPPVGSDQPVTGNGSTSSPEQVEQFPSTKVEPGSLAARTKSQASNVSGRTKASTVPSASRVPNDNSSAKSESSTSKVSHSKPTVVSPGPSSSAKQSIKASSPDVPVLDVRQSNTYSVSGSQVVEGKLDTKHSSRASGATSPRTPATKRSSSTGPKKPSSRSESVKSNSRTSHLDQSKSDISVSGMSRRSGVPRSEQAKSQDITPSPEGTNKSEPSPASPSHSEKVIPVPIVEEDASPPTPPKVPTRTPSLSSQSHAGSMPSLSSNSGSTSPSEAASSIQTPSPSLHEASFASSVDHHMQIPISQKASFIGEVPVMNTPDDGVPSYLHQHSFNHCSLSHTSFSASFHAHPGGVSGGPTPLKPMSNDFSSGFPKPPSAFPSGAASPSGGISPSGLPKMSGHNSTSFTNFPNPNLSTSFEVNAADQSSFRYDDRQGGRNWFPPYTSYLPPTERSHPARVSTIKVPVKHYYSHRPEESIKKSFTDAIDEEYDTITRRLMARGYPNYHLVYSVVRQCGGDITVAELRLSHAQSF
ncbi:hypothetical protein IWQ62_000892 [Dispira parvispora]|uniref:PB1 domain-containing protein n=1 Tax=Dispira parvispora TaxID=1520584 RepID=A0A9W8AUX3_9FUNG|nr:hypothetical protein IWQ62_000892 [Dispira parvispora]